MHWSDQYVGRLYIVDEYDCGHLVEDVLNEFHEKEVQLPSRTDVNVFSLSKDIEDNIDEYCDLTDNPVDGDVVMMLSKGRLNHIGIFMNINGVEYVLHNMKNVGSTVVHKLRDLPKYGLKIEGIYKLR